MVRERGQVCSQVLVRGKRPINAPSPNRDDSDRKRQTSASCCFAQYSVLGNGACHPLQSKEILVDNAANEMAKSQAQTTTTRIEDQVT